MQDINDKKIEIGTVIKNSVGKPYGHTNSKTKVIYMDKWKCSLQFTNWKLRVID